MFLLNPVVLTNSTGCAGAYQGVHGRANCGHAEQGGHQGPQAPGQLRHQAGQAARH